MDKIMPIKMNLNFIVKILNLSLVTMSYNLSKQFMNCQKANNSFNLKDTFIKDHFWLLNEL